MPRGLVAVAFTSFASVAFASVAFALKKACFCFWVFLGLHGRTEANRLKGLRMVLFVLVAFALVAFALVAFALVAFALVAFAWNAFRVRGTGFILGCGKSTGSGIVSSLGFRTLGIGLVCCLKGTGSGTGFGLRVMGLGRGRLGRTGFSIGSTGSIGLITNSSKGSSIHGGITALDLDFLLLDFLDTMLSGSLYSV